MTNRTATNMVKQIDYTEDGDDMNHAIYDLYKGTTTGLEVHAMRDKYGADLVQMIGFYDDTCGVG